MDSSESQVGSFVLAALLELIAVVDPEARICDMRQQQRSRFEMRSAAAPAVLGQPACRRRPLDPGMASFILVWRHPETMNNQISRHRCRSDRSLAIFRPLRSRWAE